jgi:hypothetical protein
MTPAAQTVYVNRESGLVSESLTSNAEPKLNFILRAGARLNVIFHTNGVAEQLEAATTGRLVIKSLDAADDAALFLDTAWTLAGTDANAIYTFTGEMDSTGLRTALASIRSDVFGAQILWKEPSEAFDGSSLPFNVTIHTNYHRSDDAAPLVSADVTLVLNTDGNAFEAFVSGVSKGFLHIINVAP